MADDSSPSLFAQLSSAFASTGLEKRSTEARKWFIEKVKELNGRINRKALLSDPNLQIKKAPQWGFMYMFVYEAKGDGVLPYWDRFPLIIMTEPAEGGFYGMNLHYLHPNVRAIFLDKLMQTIKGKELNERTRLRMRYELLRNVRKYREFAPCYKRYLFSQVRTRIAQVPADQWDVAIFLPTEHFKGAAKTKVWAESKKQYLSR
jgi:hypothetical protein